MTRCVFGGARGRRRHLDHEGEHLPDAERVPSCRNSMRSPASHSAVTTLPSPWFPFPWLVGCRRHCARVGVVPWS